MKETELALLMAANSGSKLDSAAVEQAVSDWLDDHPEATTTVQDGSITEAKLDSNLKETVADVGELKSAFQSYTEITTPEISDGYYDAAGGLQPSSAPAYEKHTAKFLCSNMRSVTVRLVYPELKYMWLTANTWREDGTFLRRDELIGSGQHIDETVKYTIPEGAYNISFAFRSFNLAVSVYLWAEPLNLPQNVTATSAQAASNTEEIAEIKGVLPTGLTVIQPYEVLENTRLGYTSGTPQYPTLVSSSGISVLKYKILPGQMFFSGSLFGLNGTFRSFFLKGSDHESVEKIENWTDIQNPLGKYVTVPDGATEFWGATNANTVPTLVTEAVSYLSVASEEAVSEIDAADKRLELANTVHFISRQAEFRQGNSQNLYPYNNLVGIKNAHDFGYPEIRISVWFTSDNIPVLSHDEDINTVAKNADGTDISGTVNIPDHTLEELNNYDFGVRYGSSFAGMKITVLEDALKLCKELGMNCRIELKPDSLTSAQATILTEALHKYSMTKNASVRSHKQAVLQAIYAVASGLWYEVTLPADGTVADWMSYIDYAKAIRNSYNKVSLVVGYTSGGSGTLYPSAIASAKNEGFEICLASVHTEADMLTWSVSTVDCVEVAFVKSPYTVFANSLS